MPAFDTEAARARPGAQMFANRLRKNLKTLGAWARKEDIGCYRVYDADMPEYAFSIDLYAVGRRRDARALALRAGVRAAGDVDPRRRGRDARRRSP